MKQGSFDADMRARAAAATHGIHVLSNARLGHGYDAVARKPRSLATLVQTFAAYVAANARYSAMLELPVLYVFGCGSSANGLITSSHTACMPTA